MALEPNKPGWRGLLHHSVLRPSVSALYRDHQHILGVSLLPWAALSDSPFVTKTHPSKGPVLQLEENQGRQLGNGPWDYHGDPRKQSLTGKFRCSTQAALRMTQTFR